MGRLDGKVVAVTGAGRGIGRAVAILCAAEGAQVVVNDFGGEPDGTGSDAGPAQDVVAEIVKAGGQAIANAASITDPVGAVSIIEDAVAKYGRIDAVVNNAGFLRDRMFHKMSQADWEAVVDVHLNGYFRVSKAAAPYFKEQGSGSYVHFTSTSGLIGNVGQANYSAAKMGVVGLSNSIALDMERYNVRSNCIAPFAWSRLVGTVPVGDSPERAAIIERKKQVAPEKVAPLAAFLCSDDAAPVNAQIFAIRKNEVFLFNRPVPIRTIHREDGWTVQSMAEQMLPAFAPSFTPLRRSRDLFGWDEI